VNKRTILRSERGFTLVELGIVMAIIAILAAVAYPTYTGMRERAYLAEAKATIQEARVDVWASFVQDDAWPTSYSIATTSTHWTFAYSRNGSAQPTITATTKAGSSNNLTPLVATLNNNGTVTWSGGTKP